MISTQTVLVLGAGASAPYGFPLARGLRDAICSSDRTGAAIREAVCGCGFAQTAFDAFVETLRWSGRSSVDWFLEDFPDFKEIGRVAIAATIIPCEDPRALAPGSLRGRRGQGGSWYESLWNTLDF